MSKQITFPYKGKEYTLEYTKNTVRQINRHGFSLDKLNDDPMTIYDLFAGAFLKNHATVKRAVIDEIYAQMNNKEVLLNALIEMYMDPMNGLMDEGNLEWTPNWQTEEAEA